MTEWETKTSSWNGFYVDDSKEVIIGNQMKSELQKQLVGRSVNKCLPKYIVLSPRELPPAKDSSRTAKNNNSVRDRIRYLQKTKLIDILIALSTVVW